MNCHRALLALTGFSSGKLAFTSPEVEELIKLGLVVEADPDDAKALAWLSTTVRQYAEVDVFDPTAPAILAAKIAEISEKLESDWSRFTSSDKKIATREAERRDMRRALALLKDELLMADLAKLQTTLGTLSEADPQMYACPELGDELYAITPKGRAVAQALSARVDRYGDHPLGGFVAAHDKAATKMAAFGTQIATLSSNVGYVRKNPHQVVIGLAKAGDTNQALRNYHASLGRLVASPDAAVTIARTADKLGGAAQVVQRLQVAEQRCTQYGISPNVAKVLLAYDSLDAAIQRLAHIKSALVQRGFNSATLIDKWAARLFPADGTPDDVVRRAQRALGALRQLPSRVARPQAEHANAIALAAMVKSDDAVDGLVARFRAIEQALFEARISASDTADEDALECVACAGTPYEVVDTVASLARQIARQQKRALARSDIAVAVAFAKRFVY